MLTVLNSSAGPVLLWPERIWAECGKPGPTKLTPAHCDDAVLNSSFVALEAEPDPRIDRNLLAAGSRAPAFDVWKRRK